MRALVDAMDHDAGPLPERGLAAGEDVDLDPTRHERLRELAHVPGEPALHDRGVLPRQDENARHVAAHRGSGPQVRPRPAAATVRA